MRTLLVFAALLLSAGAAHAETLAQICNRFSSSETIQACFAASRGLPMDEKALRVCNRFSSAESIFSCISAAAGREYTEEEVASCNRFSNLETINGCLQVAGRFARVGSGSRCRDRVADALAACRRSSRGAAAVLACLEQSFDLE